MRLPVLTALSSGLLFGVGLIVSGMANPAKVLGFLDLAGRWDPSLAFVMGGAIGVGFFAFRLAHQQPQTCLGQPMQLPKNNRLDAKLIVGNLLFGAGWGLAGFCPGPALVASASGAVSALIFTAVMLISFWIGRALSQRL